MQGIRDVLRGSLGRSLRTLPDEDRLAAAWPVACGSALAQRAEVLGLDGQGVLHVRVLEPAWRSQFFEMRAMLTAELSRIAGVRLETIHFEEQSQASEQGRREAAARKVGTRRTGTTERKERRKA